MLRLMLDSHPDLAVPWESHFIVALWKDRRRYLTDSGVDARGMATAIAASPMFHQWQIPEKALWRRICELEQPTFAEVIDAAFMAFADCHGKARWGDKTPIYVRSIPLLAVLSPTARFVHLIRDGRDVALSYLSVPWGPSDIWQAAQRWRIDVSSGRRAGAALGPSRYLEVRYEDLIDDPRGGLERVCRISELPFDEAMLEYHRDAAERLHAPGEHEAHHGAATKPPTQGLRDWRTQMEPRSVEVFEAVAGHLLGELGYPRGATRIPAETRLEAAARMALLSARSFANERRKALVRRFGSPSRTPGASPQGIAVADPIRRY
jgi:hypothetical protein